MSEEIFDVVNDRDEVIDRRPRAEVHRRHLKHRAVHVLVFDRAGRLFLQKRSMHKDTWPGAWDSSASGHLNSGEDYGACAVRELREEIGVQLTAAPERLFKIDACEATGMEFVWVYRLEHEGPFELDPHEIERGDWFDAATLSRRINERPGDFASAFVLIWNLLRERRLLP
jgi:isopentenyldiphosphate isomerase